MAPLLKTIRQLCGYALVATLLISPIGWFYAVCGIGCFFRSAYCFNQWLALDILACTTIHNVRGRTISGYTGERLNIRRYKLQAAVIDFLAILCGDGKDHCLRAFHWEQETGRVKYYE